MSNLSQFTNTQNLKLLWDVLLDEIHNNSVDSEDGNNLDDFKPPPPPISSGVEKTEERTKGKDTYRISGSPPRPIYEDSNLEMNNIKSVYGTAKKNDEYYNNHHNIGLIIQAIVINNQTINHRRLKWNLKES